MTEVNIPDEAYQKARAAMAFLNMEAESLAAIVAGVINTAAPLIVAAELRVLADKLDAQVTDREGVLAQHAGFTGGFLRARADELTPASSTR